jgi:predicted P-loop ATPase
MYADAGYCLTPISRGPRPKEKDRGKVPNGGWEKTGYNANPSADAFPENFGIVLQDSDLVVDVDPRNYVNGINSLEKLQLDLGWVLKGTSTPIVRSGAGGLHIYLKKPADHPIKKNIAQYPGIDFLSKGCQVVGARSQHVATKMFYNVINGTFQPGTIPQAPKNLLELIRKELHVAVQTEPVITADVQTVQRYREYLETAQPAIQGHAGDRQTYMVACHGRDLGLPETLTAELMGRHYNARCVPPWSDEELAAKVVNAYNYAQNSPGALSPQSDFEAVKPKTGEPELHWDVTDNGQKKKTLNNCANYFKGAVPELVGVVAWDEFTDQVMIIARAPWHPEDLAIPKDGLPWTDEDTTMCRYFLSKTKHFDVHPSIINEAVTVAAKRHPNHPVRNHLNSLGWDGTPRLDTWLVEYCGVADTPYARAVGAKTVLGAVARVFQPGVKFDYMLVLEGNQGTGKSTVVAILGGHWYGDLVIDPHNKDTVAAMRGKWIIEASEMVFTKAEAAAQKAFLSRQVDVVRLAYARLTKSLARQCIFIGTMNLEADAGWLTDTTGNRRFWPVLTTDIRLKELRAVRDQLMAEAVYRYKQGETLYIDDVEVHKMAVAEQHARRQIDPWAEKIKDWLMGDAMNAERKSITAMEVWVECLNGIEKQLDRRNLLRIAHVMKNEIGWKHGNVWNQATKKMGNGYRRPDYDPLVENGMLEAGEATS